MNRIRKMPIKYHLMLWFSLAMAVVMLISGWVTYSFVKSVTEDRVMEQLANTNKATVKMIETTSGLVIKDQLRITAEKNIEIIEDYYKRYRAGEITEQEARRQAENVLLSQKIGQSGYIYVLDSSGRLVVHPRPQMKGRDMSAEWLAKKQIAEKNGFVEYEWQNPDEDRRHQKVLFMRYFEPWDWIVSVSCYREEFRSLFSLEDFWSSIEDSRFGETGHSFILLNNGEELPGPRHADTGISRLERIDSDTLRRIMEMKNGRLSVVDSNPAGKTVRRRQMVFHYLPFYDWILVSAVQLDEEFLPLLQLRRIFLLTSLCVFLLILPVSLLIGARITRPLVKLIARLNGHAANGAGEKMDENGIGEVGILARHFNRYVEGLTASRRALQSEINTRIEAEQQLKLFAKVFENALEGIVITDDQANVIAVNEAFSTITGYSEQEVLGHNPRVLKSNRHDQAFYREMWRQITERGSWVGEIWNRRKSGEAYPEILSISCIYGNNGELTHYVSVFHDITEMKVKEEQIRYQAYHDALTGLPNRILANDRLEMAILHARRSGAKVGLFFLDLDHFKTVNDSLGHAFGDELLQKVGRRLMQAVRAEDTVARLGGDEFLVVAVDITSEQQVVELAERLMGCCSKPFDIGGHELHVSFSIGVTLFPDDGEDIAQLTKHADVAMYQAKQQGRNSYSLFTTDMGRRALRRLDLERELRQAIRQRQFTVQYQPKINPRTNRLSGVEALVRWQKPDGSLVPPAEFIPLAEETGLIIPLGEIVLEESCRALLQLDELGLQCEKVAVNLSPVQFMQPELVDRIVEILAKCGFDPHRLELEITETTMMTNLQEGLARLNLLVDLGISIAIDDFGTGYSSLYYLKNLPIDTIKIDRSFVRDITHDTSDAQIVETIILMANNLGIGVVAEGVETKEQLNLLRQYDCEQIQGYFFSKPLPLEQLVGYLQMREGGIN